MALIVPQAGGAKFAADARNALVLAPVTSGQPLRYHVGAAWTPRHPFATRADWEKHVAEEAARLRAPVSVSLAAETDDGATVPTAASFKTCAAGGRAVPLGLRAVAATRSAGAVAATRALRRGPELAGRRRRRC